MHVVIDSMAAGGAELLLADFAAGAPAANVELSVTYLTRREREPARARLAERGVEPMLVPIASLLDPRSVTALRRHLRALGPDLVHTQLAYSDALGGLAARSLGLPCVSSVHVMQWGGDLRKELRARLIAAARRRCAARVVVVSEAARQAFLDAGWDTPERVVTIHNGIAAQPRPGAGAAVRAGLGLAPDALVVALLGVLRPGKGHAEAIGALELLAGRRELRLLVVGDGPGRAELERDAARLGGRVALAGHRDDVMAVLDAVDVLLHPSHFDAFPTALLEAMATSVPVVATRVGGIPEIVVAGETGTLVDPPPTPAALAAALEPLLADPGERRRLGAAGRARFEACFTVAHWARRMRALYDELVPSTSPSSVST